MRVKNKLTIVLVLGLLLVSSLACSLSEFSASLDEPAATAAPATVIVEVTPTPLPLAPSPQPASIDIEEQLVIDVYARVGPAVVCITAPQRFGECIGSGFVIDHGGPHRHQQPRGR